MMTEKGFQNRIKGIGTKSASEFNFNPLNWRKHPESQEAALRKVLSSVGWITGVIVNVRTGNLIDGHARVEAALNIGPDEKVPYIEIDLTENEEKKMLLLFDPITGMAETNQEALQELIDSCEDLDNQLLAALNDFIELVPDFSPGTLEDQGKLDELNMIVCPNCNHEFAR